MKKYLKAFLIVALLAVCGAARAQNATASLTAQDSVCPAVPVGKSVNRDAGALEMALVSPSGAATLTVSGTWSGTISFFVSGDNSTTWVPLYAASGNSTAVDSSTANGTYQANVAGYSDVCMIFSTYSSGTAVATIQLSPASARNGGSVNTAGLAPNQNAIYASPNCGTQTNCYPIKATGGYDCGSSWAVSNTTIALSGNATRNFTSSDVGTIAWGAAYPCGAAIEAGIPIEIAKTTIASVTDSTHAVLAGSGPTNNCTAGGEGNCTFVWGDTDETAALAAAYQAATANPASCKFLYLPQGVIFVSAIIQASSICGGPGNATAAGTTSGGVIGVGERGSVIAMEPGFSAAGCPSTCTAFFNELQGVLFKDFSINGFGANITNVPSSLTLLQIGNDSLADNVGLYAIATTQPNIVGFAASGIAGENGYTRNVHVAGVGANECVLDANTVNWAPYCIGGSWPLTINGGPGNVYTYGGNFGFVSTGTYVAVENSATAVWYSEGDQFYFEHSGQPLVNVANQAFLSNDTLTLQGTGWALISSGKVTLNNTTIAAPNGTAVFSNSGATVVDAGGNKESGSTVFGGTGSYVGEANSVNPTTLATGNLTLSANWGTSPTKTAFIGGDFPAGFTITNGSGSTGTSPTITWTFPTPLPVAPFSCTVTQRGGTNATGTFTVSSLTATGFTATYSLTPTASDTEIVYAKCDTP